MSDLLLELGKNPQMRNLIKTLGLPIPVPQDLKRAKGAYEERSLSDLPIALMVPSGSSLGAVLSGVLFEAGALLSLVSDDEVFGQFVDKGEAFGRSPSRLDLSDISESLRHGALVFDGTMLRTAEDLKQLYDFFHPLVRSLKTSGRIVVLGRRAEEAEDVNASATQAALEGFVRSLAKEVGKKGATAQLLTLSKGAEDRIAGPLRFLLSPRSAYISGQPLHVSALSAEAKAPHHWVFPLEGKIALVTGAARGIGAATARRLSQEGAKVICLDRPQDDGPTSKLAREIDAGVLLVDITDPGAPAEISDALSERYEGVDIVVHNAGVTRDKTLARMRSDLWDQTIDVNLGAVMRITEALLEGPMREQGRLICLSSIAGIAGNMGQTNYAASKSGIIGYVRHLAQETAAQGITVNAIAPGFIETRLTDAIPLAIREVARRMNNLGQGGRPLDVAEAITFLATPAAQGLSGQVLRVCGGSLVGA